MLSKYLAALCAASTVSAFSFSFTEKPTQCGSNTVTVDGGTPPYRLVMVPSGPLEGRPEIRTIVDEEFDSSPHTLPPLNFPGGSNFTAVMSDSTGVGTGGTSVITDVANSDDSSCLATEPTTPLFYLQLPNGNTLTQCGSLDVAFSDAAQGDVTLFGLIPGGESFGISIPSGARSATWSPIRVTEGTGLMLVAGDSRGRGTGGSSYMLFVQGGSSGCLNDGQEVYSSTPAPYAGGQYATGSGGGTVTGPWQNGPTNGPGSSSSSSSNKTGIIVGVVCGVVGLIALLIILFLIRRRSKAKQQRDYGGTKEVDLLKGDRPALVATSDGQRLEPTPFYAPANNRNTTPPSTAGNESRHRPSTSIGTTNNFGGDQQSVASHEPLVPPSSWNPAYNNVGANNQRPTTPSATTDYSNTHSGITDTYGGGTSVHDPPISPATTGFTTAGAAAGRQEYTKSAEGPARLRPLNIIQHEDAGGVPATEETPAEAEVVELPPSYNDVRRGAGGNHVSP